MLSTAHGRLVPWFLGFVVAISGLTVHPVAVRGGVLDASWIAPTTNADGSALTDLASYRFYYATAATPCPGGSSILIPSSTPRPAAGESVAVTITGLTAGTQYYASVTAVDTGGGESDCSAPVQSAVARIDFTVTPTTTTSFGSLAVGGFADRTFTVQNTGGGTISGAATTSAPFSIVSGGSFSLAGAGSSHVVTVRFRPTVAATVSANVSFTTTSGDTISRLVSGTGTATDGGDTTAPTVAITGPTTAATYTTSSLSLTLSGTAADAGGVSQVTWASSRGGSGTATGTTTWTAGGIVLAQGDNVLTVTARDAAGNIATDAVTVTVPATGDTTPPAVSLTAPASGSTASGTITVSANATDDVAVAGVQFKLDGANLGAEITAAPYTVAWNTTTATAGTHALTAVARDAAGNTAASTAVTVTVGSGAATTLLTNGNFEKFSGGVATAWTLVTDGAVAVTAARVSGLSGNAQRITITTPGTWGFALYQKPQLTLNQTYEWTLSYRTNGTNTVWAQITDAAATHILVSRQLPGTSGAWRQTTLTFTYTDAAADLLRITSNSAGSMWLDAFILREVDAPLLSNGSFDAFSGKIATGWKVSKDGVVTASPAKATGLTGLAQRIIITSAGTWGLYVHQEVVLKLNTTYEWTLSYRTSGANAVWAHIADAAVNHVVLAEELPGTGGAWKQHTVTFTYTNPRANLLRITADAVGSVWLDAFSLREAGAPIVANGSFEFFSNGVATRWQVATDGVAGATVARAAGHEGLAQRINITSPGTWGLLLDQQVVLEIDQAYEWTFWYKTSGSNTARAQVSDSAGSRLVLSEELPGTGGVWTKHALTFTYTNARADRLRLTSNAVGSVWVDDLVLLEVAP